MNKEEDEEKKLKKKVGIPTNISTIIAT